MPGGPVQASAAAGPERSGSLSVGDKKPLDSLFAHLHMANEVIDEHLGEPAGRSPASRGGRGEELQFL